MDWDHSDNICKKYNHPLQVLEGVYLFTDMDKMMERKRENCDILIYAAANRLLDFKVSNFIKSVLTFIHCFLHEAR